MRAKTVFLLSMVPHCVRNMGLVTHDEGRKQSLLPRILDVGHPNPAWIDMSRCKALLGARFYMGT